MNIFKKFRKDKIEETPKEVVWPNPKEKLYRCYVDIRFNKNKDEVQYTLGVLEYTINQCDIEKVKSQCDEIIKDIYEQLSNKDTSHLKIKNDLIINDFLSASICLSHKL